MRVGLPQTDSTDSREGFGSRVIQGQFSGALFRVRVSFRVSFQGQGSGFLAKGLGRGLRAKGLGRGYKFLVFVWIARQRAFWCRPAFRSFGLFLGNGAS